MIHIQYEPENKRSAAYDQDKLVGQCTYVIDKNVWTIEHTLVDKDYGGQGIAGKLVDELVTQAKNQGIQIHPVCTYAKKHIETKYQEILA